MSSEAKKSASRINGARSRGPVTELGKNTSRMNATKDGAYAQSLILPGEDAQKFQARLGHLIEDLQPRDETEAGLVHEIAAASWIHQRVMRAQFQRLKTNIDGAENREDDEIDEDLYRLFSDGRGPHCMYGLSTAACGGPQTSYPEKDKKKGEEVESPSVTVRRLEGNAKGCAALIDIWKSLKERVEKGQEIQSHDRLKATRMLGKQPIQVLEDERVWLIFFASHVLHPLEKHAFRDLKTDMTTPELEAFVPRAKSRWAGLLDESDKGKARQMLLDLFERNIERLEAKREAHLEHAEERAANRAGRLANDDSSQGERLARHELACHRRVQRCRDAFWKHRREMGREENARWQTENEGHAGANGEGERAPEQEKQNEPMSGSDAAEFAVFKELMARDEGIRRTVKEIAEGAEMIKQIEGGKLSIGELLNLARSPLLNPTPPG
jgi:hypothetical protein